MSHVAASVSLIVPFPVYDGTREDVNSRQNRPIDLAWPTRKPNHPLAMSYGEKLDKIGPRKLLALDGGAIRGVITLEVLAKISLPRVYACPGSPGRIKNLGESS
jgi:hypothetical protein